MPLNEPARTAKDNRGGEFLHWVRDRVMTPRELAGLQSFPVDGLFCGSKGDVLKQIGYAVPPLLARAVGECDRGMFDSVNAPGQASVVTNSMTDNQRDQNMATLRGGTIWT